MRRSQQWNWSFVEGLVVRVRLIEAFTFGARVLVLLSLAVGQAGVRVARQCLDRTTDMGVKGISIDIGRLLLIAPTPG